MHSKSSEPVDGRHFGVPVRRGFIHDLRINRATYTNVSRTVSDPFFYRYALEKGHLSKEEAAKRFVDPVTCREYTEAFAQAMVERALRNFDLNMLHFERLGDAQFHKETDELLAAFPELEPVTNLEPWTDKHGVYLMVLDGHRQLYLGQSIHIGKRIRQHWTNSKRLDRLVYGKAEESILSIDSFRALDTTRIYARSHGLNTEDKRDTFEEAVVKHIDPDFSLNRINGGHIFKAVASERENGVKTRNLAATDEEWAVYWAKVDATQMGREVHPRGYRRPSTKRSSARKPPPTSDDGDPVGALVLEANRRKRTVTLLVDAGGTIIEVCEGPVTKCADGYIQLFEIPCGMSISRNTIEAALRLAPGYIGDAVQPPVTLFKKLGRSAVSLHHRDGQ